MDYILTVNISPAAAGSVMVKPSGKYIKPGQTQFPAGTVLTMTTFPRISGASFDHWEGAITGTANTTTLTMDSNKSVKVVFAISDSTATVELSTSVTGNGNIAPSSGKYNPGDQTIMVATPDTGNVFVFWSGDTDGSASVPGNQHMLLVVMDKARHIVAEFQAEAPSPSPTVSPMTSMPLVIPHPEESMNLSARSESIDAIAVINKWLTDWGVPAQYWDYWQATDVQVYEIYPARIIAMGINQNYLATTWEADGKHYLAIKPQWLNPGVIAHEQAHHSYGLLSSSQKAAFSAIYISLKNTDPLINLLYSKNDYGLANDMEGHAEVYRYIGQQMPTQLKTYYPKLF